MTPQQYERLTELFHAALATAPTKREIFLDRVSESDAELRCELESLLAAQATALTAKPPDDIAAAYVAQQADGNASISLAHNTRLDHYEIRSLLGKGGMGEVYLAKDLRLQRQVALKILPAEVASNQDRMRRFEQEATIAAALSHPHIAQIFEIGEHEGTHLIAMEYIDGCTLRDRIHRDKASLQKLLKYLTQVAEGLSKAHAAGIVHRDLKPDNIMITHDDYAKILDFGLAKLIEPERLLDSDSGLDASSETKPAIIAHHSLAGEVMGTLGYMSPEQAQGKVEQIDHRSDVFSFGCILFEAVTRHRPFADESVIKSLHKTAYASPPPIKHFNPSAPPDLHRIVRRCLAKDREDRYQTIKEVAIELKELRRELESNAGLRAATAAATSGTDEPSNRPGAESTTSRTAALSPTATATLAAPASRAEYKISGIKVQRRGALLALALVAMTATVAYFGYTRPRPGSTGAKRSRRDSFNRRLALCKRKRQPGHGIPL
jgi:serine/threonine protein kinase